MGPALVTIFAVLALALVGHVAIVTASPYVMMRRQMKIYLTRQEVNQLGQGRRASADVRTAARRPNADMLLSNAVFDLGQGPMLFSSPVPRDHYWSVSFFSTNSDCFFAVNHVQVGSDSVTIVLTAEGAPPSVPQGALVVTSPSKRGIVAVRQAIPHPDKLAQVAALQDRATIRPAPQDFS